ncbi:MAG: peptidoglycan DD-metalloendopeptidase family protein [Prevotellaceae bacterium]|jgi:murein DD-endopeptidase MepM/ murein hydrolase activator NlpD|nr:peptidoglycan DD-metalloendopeptidase family protein [Prevotellaceae bacterium]
MKKIIATLPLMLCTVAMYAASIFTFGDRAKKHEKNSISYTVMLPKLNVEIKIPTVEIEELPAMGERYTDLDEDSGEGGTIPASDLYAIWDNLKVNPYKISSDSVLINDSVHLDLTGFHYPLAKHYKVTSEFGPRRYRFHHGIDLKVYKGDSILNAMDGMVRIAKRVGAYGNLVVIRHSNGLESFYGHLSKILVKQDQAVKAGCLIGLGGSTGRSTGTHLHFELRYLGQCVNPRDLVDFDSLCVKSDTVLLTQNNFDYRKSASSSAISSGRIWTVRKGDCLGLIAKRTGTSVRNLCYLNGITVKTIIKPGKKLVY